MTACWIRIESFSHLYKNKRAQSQTQIPSLSLSLFFLSVSFSLPVLFLFACVRIHSVVTHARTHAKRPPKLICIYIYLMIYFCTLLFSLKHILYLYTLVCSLQNWIGNIESKHLNHAFWTQMFWVILAFNCCLRRYWYIHCDLMESIENTFDIHIWWVLQKKNSKRWTLI